MPTFLQTSLPETLPELEEQVRALEKAQKQCTEGLRILMASEDPQKGVFFAAEIHELRQCKNMLESYRQHRQARIRRLEAGF